jgi:hypothetical protein
MHDLKAGDLSIAVTTTPAAGGATLRLDWRGRSTDRQPEIVLTPFFRQALDAAAPGGTLELHFEALDHFNSSTITAIIGLVAQARARGVRLALIYDPSLRWQKLSFEALTVFRKDDGLLELRPTS